jgi:hypothetical protein
MIRRGGLCVSIAVMIVGAVLLLNFTAPNPTGRRYSSDTPVLSGSSNEIGASAEIILSHDLGVPKNTTNFDGVIPDFITEVSIIESKNCAALPCENRGQFERLLILSQTTGRELWVYTRIGTRIPDDMQAAVVNTGGSIVPYFVVPPYRDATDSAAILIIGVGASVSSFFVVWEYRALKRRGVTFMITRQPLYVLIAAVGVIVLTLLVLNINAVRIALSALETIMSIVFFSLASVWIYRQIRK